MMNAKTKWMIALTGLTMTITALAQAQVNTANYWVVEGNVKTRDFTIVRFYDPSGNILHEERVDGKKLDITKKKDVKILNRKLRDFDATPETKRTPRKTRKRPI